jgi:hypothetical protein
MAAHDDHSSRPDGAVADTGLSRTRRGLGLRDSALRLDGWFPEDPQMVSWAADVAYMAQAQTAEQLLASTADTYDKRTLTDMIGREPQLGRAAQFAARYVPNPHRRVIRAAVRHIFRCAQRREWGRQPLDGWQPTDRYLAAWCGFVHSQSFYHLHLVRHVLHGYTTVTMSELVDADSLLRRRTETLRALGHPTPERACLSDVILYVQSTPDRPWSDWDRLTSPTPTRTPPV